MAKEKQFEPETNYPFVKNRIDLVETPGGLRLAKNDIISTNYIHNETGFKIGSDGTIEANGVLKLGNKLESTNFKKLLTEPSSGISIWLSDQTTPDGNLSGVEGDICLNCSATGQMAYNDDGTTNWTLL